MRSVTKPRKKNLGGRPRVHESNAAKQKAYRDRIRRELARLDRKRKAMETDLQKRAIVPTKAQLNSLMTRVEKASRANVAAYLDYVTTAPAVLAKKKRRTK